MPKIIAGLRERLIAEAELQLEKGETYSYSITARLGTYDEIVVKEDSFING